MKSRQGSRPEGLITEIGRNSQYSIAEWRALDTSEIIDPDAVLGRLRAAPKDAEDFVARMPSEKLGLLFLEGAKVIQPDVTRLDSYQARAGQRRGHWPSSPEITAAMFERAAQDRRS